MTEKDFRRIALGMQGAVEGAHMGHPDFRVNGRIFATLHHDRLWGMVKLLPEQQQAFLRQDSETFKPESGTWGRQGCTAVHLASVDEETLGEALTLAWQNMSKQGPAKRSQSSTTVRRTRSSRRRSRW